MSTCTRCHRPLTNPASQKLGFGPICASRRSAEADNSGSTLSIPPKSWPDFDYQKAVQELSAKTDDAEYIAERFAFGVAVTVRTDMDRPMPHIMYHSPDGFEMGYGGSGPSDLARSILVHAVGFAIADRLYHDFKFEYVAGAKDSLRVSLSEIRAWVTRKIGEAQS